MASTPELGGDAVWSPILEDMRATRRTQAITANVLVLATIGLGILTWVQYQGASKSAGQAAADTVVVTGVINGPVEQHKSTIYLGKGVIPRVEYRAFVTYTVPSGGVRTDLFTDLDKVHQEGDQVGVAVNTETNRTHLATEESPEVTGGRVLLTAMFLVATVGCGVMALSATVASYVETADNGNG